MLNVEGQKRKSARISALETANKDKTKKESDKNLSTQHHQVGEASQRNTTPPPPPLRPPLLAGSGSGSRPSLSEPKKGLKKKRLDEVAGSSVAPTTRQDRENPKHEDIQASDALSPSAQWMPGKQLLEFILDILQRRDTHEIFAQPVDGEEVEGYYDIIKEPMDFGTMRAKLQEGMYTTLEQFEKDVFLISSNAMLFNSSTTIFFRQARAIHELAKRVFHTLKTDPRKIEEEFSQTRKRPGRKPQVEAGPSSTKPANLRRNARACRGSSSSDPLIDRRDNAVLPGSGNGRHVKFCETERRLTYKPRSSLATENEPIVSTVYNCLKQLVPGNGGLSYKESLLQFVKHLGPTAKMVAQRKIGSLTEAPIYQSQKSSNSVEYTNGLISFPTTQQGPVIENQMPRIFRNRPGHSVIIRDANDRLGIHAATLKGKTVQPSGWMDIHGGAASEQTDMHHAASKGKNVFTGEGMDILSGGMKAYAIDRGNMDAASKGKSAQTGEGMEIHGGTYREWMALTRGRMADHGATSKGKNVVTGGSMDIYGGTCGRNMDVASDRADNLGAFEEAMVPSSDTVGVHSAIQRERAHGSNRVAADSALCGGITADSFSARKIGELSRLMIQPGENMSLLLQSAGEDIAHQDQNTNNPSSLNFPSARVGSFRSPTAGVIDAHDHDQVGSYLFGAGHAAGIPDPCGKYMTANTMVDSSQLGDQIQPVQLASGSQSGLLEFMSRGRRPRSFVHPSKVIMPSSLSQTNTLSHALDSHSLGGVDQTNAQLIHNYRASSSQLSQAVEWSLPTPWGSQAICDFSHVQPQQLVSVPYMQAGEANPMGQGVFVPQQSQLVSPPFMGQLSTGMNPLSDSAFLQQQQLALAGNMQPQPNAVNMLGQDAFAQGAQLGMVPSMHPQPSSGNPLEQDVHVRQDPHIALAQHMQPEPNAFLQQGGQFAVPPQGLVFNTGNIHERAPSQGHQTQITPNEFQMWNHTKLYSAGICKIGTNEEMSLL